MKALKSPKRRIHPLYSAALAVAAASGLISPRAALATSDIWDGSTDSSWATNTNWSTDPAVVPGAGASVISGAMTAGTGSINLFKTGPGTLTLSGGGTFAGNGVAFGGDAGTGPGLFREGTTRITGGSYSFTGEVTVGGVVSNGGE